MGVLSEWMETIMLSVAFVVIFGIVVTAMNHDYNKTETLGLTEKGQATQQLFITYQDTASGQLKGGDVAFDAQNGVQLKSSWGIAKDAMSIVFSFLTGGWIETVVSYMNLGESGSTLALSLRVIYFISLILGMLYAFFKVVL